MEIDPTPAKGIDIPLVVMTVIEDGGEIVEINSERSRVIRRVAPESKPKWIEIYLEERRGGQTYRGVDRQGIRLR